MAEESTGTEAGTAPETGTETTFDADAWQQVAEKVGESPDDVLKKLEHARTWEKRAKENAEAAEKLAEIEEQQKTETERLQDKLTAETAQREQLERQAMRYRVAAVKGLPADLIDRLQGDTEEDLAADADKLLELVTPKQQETGTQPGPRPDLSQGSSGNGTALNGDPLLNDLKSKLGIG